MSAESLKSAKHYARMICKYMKNLPDHYADEPQAVQDALGLTDAEFKLGLDWCIERKIIALETAKAETKSTSPFTEDETEPVKPVAVSAFTEEETSESAPVGEPALAGAGTW